MGRRIPFITGILVSGRPKIREDRFFLIRGTPCVKFPPPPNRHLIQNHQPLKNNGFESDDWEASNLQSSNEKKKPRCLGYTEDEILPIYVGIISNNEIRIPIKQPGFNGK